jgi:hypothetical protein
MSEFSENNSPRRSPGGLPKWVVPFLVFDAVLITGALAWVMNKPTTPSQNLADVTSAPTAEMTPATNSQKFELFVPNDDARLIRKTVTDENISATASYGQKASRALELLFPQIEFLPTGLRTVAEPVKDKNGVVRVNLNKEFLKLNTAHETPVMLSLDAIARTLGALDSQDGKTFKPVKVLFLVEGKTIPTLSEFSLNEPWTASETDSTSSSSSEDAV